MIKSYIKHSSKKGGTGAVKVRMKTGDKLGTEQQTSSNTESKGVWMKEKERMKGKQFTVLHLNERRMIH